MEIKVVGGVYTEYCAWPNRLDLLGSAGRAALCLLQLSKETSVELISSFAQEDSEALLEQFAFSKGKVRNIGAEKTTEFFYDHPLAKPKIYPSLDHISTLPLMQIDDLSEDKVVLFGMYEKTPVVSASHVIYDPQNTLHPRLYSEHGAKADNLIYVLNRKELTFFYEQHSGKSADSMEDMAIWLLKHESADAVVVKCGAKGAFVLNADEESNWISACLTKKVNPIGSGDSYVAAFAHYHFVRGMDVFVSAKMASAAAAFYVEHKTMSSDKHIENSGFTEAPMADEQSKVRKVYLAGPFFNMGQMWLINHCKVCLEAAGFDVFSPYHEIGIGPAEVVASADIEALDECDVVYALFDDHDPGTLFEIGYAIKANKPVIVYSEKSTDEHLKMYEGTGCIIERDFATSIYRASWL